MVIHKFLDLLNINLNSPKGYLKVFVVACICGFVVAFVKDVFMF